MFGVGTIKKKTNKTINKLVLLLSEDIYSIIKNDSKDIYYVTRNFYLK